MKYLSLILVTLLLVGCSSEVENEFENEEEDQINTVNNNQEETNNQQDNNGITLSELQQHDNEEDCWVAYNGKVYDVTLWLPDHPGGSRAIDRHCGTAEEFANAFTKQHGTKMANMLMTVAVNKGDYIG